MGGHVSSRKRARLAALTATVLACPLAVLAATSAAAPPSAAPEVPTGFQDTIAIGNLTQPTAVAFAADGTAFVAMKSGEIRAFDYNAGTDQFESIGTSTLVADLSTVVHNFHDRGLTGLAVDPQLGSGSNFVYVNYAYNRDPRDNPPVVPKWYTQQPTDPYDDCPQWAAMATGSTPAVTGCVIDVRVSRIPVVKGGNGWTNNGAEQPLIEDACMQFSSHASGDVAFGPDGWLYASTGDGASYDTEDWGQANNPCNDPANQGGSLRSQDIRTAGDPLSLSGATFRINKANGQAPNGSASNADRIVTYGQRNPWRLAFRPGTNELWSGDVGRDTWEELNRVDVSAATPVNLGWPCYEGSLDGSQRQAGWDAIDIAMCESLYGAEQASPGTVRAPYFSYQTRGGFVTPGENCNNGTSSISGIAFVPSTSDYPAEYKGSLFFNDYARGCIWRLGKLGNGNPDPHNIIPFVEAAEVPVGIEIGPGGDLFYVDYGIVDGVPTAGAGDIHRVVYTPANQAPVAALTASPPYGTNLLKIDFSASGSTDADNDPLTYEWALDGDGVFNDGGGATKTKTYSSAGQRTVYVRVTDDNGASDTEQIHVTPGNTAPTLASVSPSAALTWAVGDTVNFSATATDTEQGTLPNSAFSWSLTIEHCPSVCHSHPVTTWSGQRTGSFVTPDHEYPSDLLLQVTVTDSQGSTDTETVKLDPKSVAMTFASNPTDAALTIAGNGRFAPHTQTFIQGSNFNITAPETREYAGAVYQFQAWSDGGARSHAVVAPASATTVTASYTRQNRLPGVTLSADPPAGTVPHNVGFRATATDPDGDNAGFTYEWDLDDDGQFDDGGGATQQGEYSSAGSRTVRVRVTDSHGGQAVGSVSIRSYERSRVSVRTRPGDLRVKVDGTSYRGGWSRRLDVGDTVKVVAPKRQWRNGVLYEFVRWSDERARIHRITVPDGGVRIRAIYARV
jgi:glucose/arabinose dehydrogenase